jgi:hypothetical protein
MHRSGTSLIGGILNILGVYLGPQEAMLPAAPDNPKGFWEHRLFVELNDALLARLGGDAMHPPAVSPGWQASTCLHDLRLRAKIFLQKEFGNVKLWGWKDPRTCLTLPFWEAMVPGLRYILCLRHPLEVARSLEHRDQLPQVRALQVWLIYVQRSLLYTEGKRRLIVAYERLLADCRHEINRIAQFLDQPSLAERPEVQQAVQSFLDPSLSHGRSGAEASQTRGVPSAAAHLLQLTEQIYLALCDTASRSITQAMQLIDQALRVAQAAIEERELEEQKRWNESVNALAKALAAVIPAGDTYIFVEEDRIGRGFPGRPALPFLERHGDYWGPPADAATAIQDLERLRDSGAAHIAFPWFTFWWLEHYGEFARHLRAKYRCVVENERLIVFDLRRGC